MQVQGGTHRQGGQLLAHGSIQHGLLSSFAGGRVQFGSGAVTRGGSVALSVAEAQRVHDALFQQVASPDMRLVLAHAGVVARASVVGRGCGADTVGYGEGGRATPGHLVFHVGRALISATCVAPVCAATALAIPARD